MNEIVRHIEYLLTGNDCVVIPGLGAVIAHSLPARCDDSGLHMLPPGRTFSFNSSLTHNDGMLFSSVARAKDVTFEVAGKIVSAEVENMRAELHKTGSLSLGAAGRLVMLAETGALSFEPAPSASSLLTPAFMWLPELELTPVNSLARRRAAALAESLVSARRSLPAYIGKAVKVAASLAILIALGFVLTTPINIEQAQYASFGIENFKTRPALSDDSRRSELIRRPGELSSEIKLYLYNHNDAAETVDTAAHAASSVQGFDIYSAIDSCRDLLENFGGHTYAVGLSLKEENIPEFTRRFEKFVADNILPTQLKPQQEIDAMLTFAEITPQFISLLRKFNPFGPGNQKPVFCTRRVMDFGTSKLVGRHLEHVKLELVDNTSGKVFNGIAFNKGEYFDYIHSRKPFDICYTIEENKHPNSTTSIQLHVKDINICDD